MQFEFATATRIIFGAGAVREIAPGLKMAGLKPLVVCGRDPRRAEPLLDSLLKECIATEVFAVPGEPTLDLIEDGTARARQAGCNAVVSIGGGSVIDAGKAIAAMMTNEGEVLDY